MFKVSGNKWTFLYESKKKKKNSFHAQNNRYNYFIYLTFLALSLSLSSLYFPCFLSSCLLSSFLCFSLSNSYVCEIRNKRIFGTRVFAGEIVKSYTVVAS